MDDKTFRDWAKREYGLTDYSDSNAWQKAWYNWQMLDQMFVKALQNNK